MFGSHCITLTGRWIGLPHLQEPSETGTNHDGQPWSMPSAFSAWISPWWKSTELPRQTKTLKTRTPRLLDQFFRAPMRPQGARETFVSEIEIGRDSVPQAIASSPARAKNELAPGTRLLRP